MRLGRLAWAWMKKHSVAAVPSDKDGVFVVINKNVLEHIVNSKLRQKNPCYRAVASDAPQLEFNLMRQAILKTWASGSGRLSAVGLTRSLVRLA